jgi:Family of unknown function (DUF5682)
MTVSVLGIRHHGPGSARAVMRALEQIKPDAVLVEGPPEADGLIALAGHDQMRPPVALLAYATGDVIRGPGGARHTHEGGTPDRAAFWPFAAFSPEWCAIRYAIEAGIPVRFCDLPIAYRFGAASREPSDPGPRPRPAHERRRPRDPLGMLAEAAGYNDAERWWEDVVEHRRDGVPVFEAIAEAMTAVRTVAESEAGSEAEPDAGSKAGSEAEAGSEARPDATGPDSDLVREAHMRTVLRATVKQGHDNIAIVCGAWHVPALAGPLPPASRDAALLKGMKKTPVAVTWVPWTHGRLASWQGYGAGVASPGWYHHLFTTRDGVIERWFVAVARVLREEDLPISSAHIIEAVRLADALAALRGRPLPGLSELTEATLAVLCDGDELRLDLVQRRVVVGELLGAVPDETPTAPLARDLAAQQKRLRLAPEADVRDLDLDLRKPNDLARSHLIHRLRMLGVDWGEPASRRGTGTFWESWKLAWAPEFAVDLITASAYGTTVRSASTAYAVEAAGTAPDLAAVTALVERCLLADLPDALGPVLRALDEQVAVDVDVAHLLDALPALARSLRYGDVRGTDTAALGPVVSGLVVRACVGLPRVVTGLSDDAASEMRQRIDSVHSALKTLLDNHLTARWLDTLAAVSTRDGLPGLLAGRITRLLYDGGRLDTGEVARRMALTVSVGVPATRAAAWVEGFLAGGGLLLAHDDALLALVDAWLVAISPATFVEVLPLVRRTFSTYSAPERRAIGERLRRAGGAHPAPDASADDLDPDRVDKVLPTLRLLLGAR